MTQKRTETNEMHETNDANETRESETLNDAGDEVDRVDKAGEAGDEVCDYVMDLDTLETYFETMIVNTWEAYDLLAAFLVQLKTELELGPAGITPVSNTLDDGIDLVFQRSKAYRLARELFLMQYRGVLRPSEELEELIGPVLERARSMKRTWSNGGDGRSQKNLKRKKPGRDGQ
jgi:hypothetical protein